jgi:hypothetical protein
MPARQVIEAGSEPGSGVVAMAFARWRMVAEEVCGGPSGPAESEGGERHEQGELAWVGEAGVFEIEAAGLGVAQAGTRSPSVCARSRWRCAA